MATLNFRPTRLRAQRTPRPRDAQRARVYMADKILRPFDLVEMRDMDRLEQYVYAVWSMPEVRRAFPKAFHACWCGPPKVKDGRGRRSAGGNDYMITMPRWARVESVTLHELAHTITQRTHGFAVAGHGPEWCGIFLRLVQIKMGIGAHDELRAAYRRHRVRVQKSPEPAPLT